MRSKFSLLLLALLVIPPGVVQAQTGFIADSTWIVEIDGVASDAEVFRAQSPAAMLVMSEKLPEPVMLMLGAGSVNGVQLMKVARQPDGSVNVLANPFTRSFGSYEVDGSGVTFSVDDHSVSILPKPPLLGLQSAEALVEHDSGYGLRRDAYSPDGVQVATLATAPAGTVRVFFGSWCPACAQLVPRILAVEGAVGDSAVSFEYYGLPEPPFSGDPEAERYDVNQVPTVVLLRNGREVAKLTGNALRQPEAALVQALGG